jgi:hypothetical protein
VQPKYPKATIQTTSVCVSGLLSDIIVAAVYCPRHNLKEEHFTAFFQTLGRRFMVGGDFNSKHTLWGPSLITTKGRELAKLIQSNNFSFLSTGSPTYWPTDSHKTPDILDFFIINGFSTNYADIKASSDLTSDHYPLMATISTSHVQTTTPKVAFPSNILGHVQNHNKLKRRTQAKTQIQGRYWDGYR